MNPQIKKVTDAVIGLLFVSGCSGGFYYLYKTRTTSKRAVHSIPVKYWEVNEKPKEGRSLIEWDDSVYVIHLQIDSVYKDKDFAPESND